jgi:formylmethanofuran dehydrogenase subunit D
LKAGGHVRVLSQRTSVVLPVIENPNVARGTAFVPFGQQGGAAGQLIDAAELASTGIVKVRLETVGD